MIGSQDFLKRMVALAEGEDEKSRSRLRRRMGAVTVDEVMAAVAEIHEVEAEEYFGFRSLAAGGFRSLAAGGFRSRAAGRAGGGIALPSLHERDTGTAFRTLWSAAWLAVNFAGPTDRIGMRPSLIVHSVAHGRLQLAKCRNLRR